MTPLTIKLAILTRNPKKDYPQFLDYPFNSHPETFSHSPFGKGFRSGGPSSLSLPPRLLVSLTGGAGGLSSSLDILFPRFNFVNYSVDECFSTHCLLCVSPSGFGLFLYVFNPMYLQRIYSTFAVSNCTSFFFLYSFDE